MNKIEKQNDYKGSTSGEEARLELYVNQGWQSVGVIGEGYTVPDDWMAYRVGDAIKFQLGSTPAKFGDNYEGRVPWVTISNIKGAATHECTAKVKETLVKVLPKGSLIGSFKMTVGRFSILGMSAATNEAIVGVSPDGAPDFSLNYLRFALVKPFLEAAVTNGQGVKLLNTKTISSLVIMAPDKSEQSLIAQALSTQEAQVADLRKLAALERQRLTWLSDELLSGRLRVVEDPTAEPVVVSRDENGEPVEVLPGVKLVENDVFISCVINGKKSFIPDGWQNKKIRDIADRRKEKTNSSRNYVGLENITQNTGAYIETSGAKVVEGSTSSVFQRGDLLYGKLRPYLKKVWLADFSGTCSTEFLVLSPKCNPFFLKAHLLGEDVTDIACGMSEGTRMPRTDWHTIGNIDIMCPPSNEQSLIAAVLTAQEKQAAEIERLADLEQKRLEWLSDELLSGRLRIKVPA